MFSGVFAVLALSLLAAAPSKPRIFIDPGHGYRGNEGATTALCEREQDVVLELARDLATRLIATDKFNVRLARTSSRGPSYDERLDAANAFGAVAILSIHLDARGAAKDVGGCPRNDDERGFGILYSNLGAKLLAEKRRALSRSIATALSERGFSAYDGYQYGALYDVDTTPGVFVDRRRLFMLRKPSIPSVIIETYHGWAFDERKRWDEEDTRARFAAAIAAALETALERK